ncbi:hypothetical protein GCM10022226_50450 [Sphaerisporangium flaviroseum]|uniref:LamG domain-containing protein n=1 Tax=Sphaerisporangium flaviroseum TaxID=509199 RepID=A0ABP7IQ77_9ACTN
MTGRHIYAGHPVTAHVPPRRPSPSRRLRVAVLAMLLCGSFAVAPGAAAQTISTPDSSLSGPSMREVFPSLRRNLVAYYDFEHPSAANAAREEDQGHSGTTIDLVNGGAAMRVRDGAHPGSTSSLRTGQVDPAVAGNDDWKAGTYSGTGTTTLRAFGQARQITIMGWFKMTGQNPALNSGTPDPDDRYGAIGLAGVLSGDSQGHDVRALLEVINVSGELRVVALGRRVDGGRSQTFAAGEAWQSVLPPGEWVFLAATFDYDDGTMKLYRNGRPLDGFSTVPEDPWGVAGPPEPDLTSATDPRGIKIGGSYPQNTEERNACDCRHDDLMFLDRAATGREILHQYRWATGRHR